MSSIMGISYDSRPVQTVENQIRNVSRRDGIDLQPDYQRGYIWGDTFKDKLIYSVIRNYPIGNISLRVRREANAKGAMQEVVDGQQRLTTIFNFLHGKHALRGEFSRRTIEYIVEYLGDDDDPLYEKLKKKLKNKSVIILKYADLPEIIKGNILAYNVSITNITNATDDEIREYFRFLQNQEILRAGEIIKSLPASTLVKYLSAIRDKAVFLNKVNYSNDRRQFDKLFYSILGVLNQDISFGGLDKHVLQFASECNSLNADAEEMCYRLLKAINQITDDATIGTRYVNANARYMKFLMLLSAFGYVDFERETASKVMALSSINMKLTAFNSAKAGSVEREFLGYSAPVIEELRLLALISRGSHGYARVRNRMEILAYYVNGVENKIQPSGINPI